MGAGPVRFFFLSTYIMHLLKNCQQQRVQIQRKDRTGKGRPDPAEVQGKKDYANPKVSDKIKLPNNAKIRELIEKEEIKNGNHKKNLRKISLASF